MRRGHDVQTRSCSDQRLTLTLSAFMYHLVHEGE